MKRVLCSKLPTPRHAVILDEREANHVTKVLRLRNGDRVQAMDGEGHAQVATIQIQGEFVSLIFLENDLNTPLQPRRDELSIILEMAITKADSMSWIVEKAVELGVERLVPVLTARTVVQLDRKGPANFQERWQRIADQALKQCGRLNRMMVESPSSLVSVMESEVLGSVRLWFDEGDRDKTVYLAKWLEDFSRESISEIRILVGPEGGWEPKERDLLSRLHPIKTFRLSLGPWVLRAETAALFGVSVVCAHLRKDAYPGLYS